MNDDCLELGVGDLVSADALAELDGRVGPPESHEPELQRTVSRVPGRYPTRLPSRGASESDRGAYKLQSARNED